MLRLIAALACLLGTSGAAQAIELGMPVDCRKTGGCFIQNYADVQPGDPTADYRCGPLTYPDHDGTDFRVRTLREMEQGIPVLAMADGTVRGLRDDVPNAYASDPGQRERIGNQECGNGVMIDHADGWQSQYCHMQAGSLLVTQGQPVKRGDILGHIGLSGLTEFPHLHITLRHDGQPIDPFTGRPVPKKGQSSLDHPNPDCLASLDKSLWSVEARQQLGYVPTAIMSSGFATSAPDLQDVRKGRERIRQFTDASMLIFWTEIAGVRKDDTAITLITDPNGTIVASHEEHFDRNRAAQFRYIGLKKPPQGWPHGEYTGIYRLLRGKETILTVREKITH